MMERLITLMQKSAAYRWRFLLLLAIFCGWGSIIHFADLVGLRANFSDLNRPWQFATVYLLILDISAVFGIYLEKSWGILAYLLVGLPQILAYTAFTNIFGEHPELLALHAIAIVLLIFFSLSTLVVQEGEH